MINRRHALGLLTAASILPSRSFANVSYQRSEFRDDLAKRFFDLGTTGTFVAYKVDDVAQVLTAVREAGLETIDTKPRSGGDGRTRVGFLDPKSTMGVLTELEEDA